MHNYKSFWLYRVIPSVAVILYVFSLTPRAALAEAPIPPQENPTRLIIPGIELDSVVTPVGRKAVVVEGKIYKQWETANEVVGWHNLSATLGQAGNTVLAGHSDVYTQIFRNLKDVRIGDLIIAYANDKPYYYVVTQKVVVQEKDVPIEQRLANARWISSTGDERITLVTCAYPGATHRLIVIARPMALAYLH